MLWYLVSFEGSLRIQGTPCTEQSMCLQRRPLTGVVTSSKRMP